MEAFLRFPPPEVRREEILEHWTTLNYTEKNLDFNSMGIWHNSLIRISWLKAGVKEVRDLLNQDQTFLSYNGFVAKFNIKTKLS